MKAYYLEIIFYYVKIKPYYQSKIGRIKIINNILINMLLHIFDGWIRVYGKDSKKVSDPNGS